MCIDSGASAADSLPFVNIAVIFGIGFVRSQTRTISHQRHEIYCSAHKYNFAFHLGLDGYRMHHHLRFWISWWEWEDWRRLDQPAMDRASARRNAQSTERSAGREGYGRPCWPVTLLAGPQRIGCRRASCQGESGRRSSFCRRPRRKSYDPLRLPFPWKGGAAGRETEK
jgi:hypothetical protein